MERRRVWRGCCSVYWQFLPSEGLQRCDPDFRAEHRAERPEGPSEFQRRFLHGPLLGRRQRNGGRQGFFRFSLDHRGVFQP